MEFTAIVDIGVMISERVVLVMLGNHDKQADAGDLETDKPLVISVDAMLGLSDPFIELWTFPLCNQLMPRKCLIVFAFNHEVRHRVGRDQIALIYS